jgi:DNA-binding XRE family transcriptional regulator
MTEPATLQAPETGWRGASLAEDSASVQWRRAVGFGRTVRARREAFDLGRQLVADLAGISVRQLVGVEQGLLSPTLALMHRLADVFCTDLAELLHESRVRIDQPRSRMVASVENLPTDHCSTCLTHWAHGCRPDTTVLQTSEYPGCSELAEC